MEESWRTPSSPPPSPESPDAGAGEDTDGFLIRRTAVDFGVSLVTNMKCAALLAMALERVKSFHIRR